MSDLTIDVRSPVETASGGDWLTLFREALSARLDGDATLQALLGGPDRVFHRMVKKVIEPRTVTYFDLWERIDFTVPLMRGTVQIDVWDTRMDRAQQMAAQIDRLLDGRPFGVIGRANVAFLGLSRASDEAALEGEISRTMREYSTAVYNLGS